MLISVIAAHSSRVPFSWHANQAATSESSAGPCSGVVNRAAKVFHYCDAQYPGCGNLFFSIFAVKLPQAQPAPAQKCVSRKINEQSAIYPRIFQQSLNSLTYQTVRSRTAFRHQFALALRRCSNFFAWLATIGESRLWSMAAIISLPPTQRSNWTLGEAIMELRMRLNVLAAVISFSFVAAIVFGML